MARTTKKRFTSGRDASISVPAAAAPATTAKPQVGHITVGRAAVSALRPDSIGTTEDGPCCRGLPQPSRNEVFAAAAPPSSDFPAKLHIALLDEDEKTHRVLRQIIQSHAPTWTLHVVPDAHPATVEAWLKAAKARNGSVKNKTNPPPQIVIMDIGGLRDDRIQWIRKLKWMLPACRVLVLTRQTSTGAILSALKEGAEGYLIKPQDAALLAKAIREIMEGGLVACREAQSVILNCLRQGGETGECLTRREWDVVQGLASGLADKAIAGDLGIAPGTVHALTRRIFRKLNAHTRREAVQRATGAFCDRR